MCKLAFAQKICGWTVNPTYNSVLADKNPDCDPSYICASQRANVQRSAAGSRSKHCQCPNREVVSLSRLRI
jgi:hypothetical protein